MPHAAIKLALGPGHHHLRVGRKATAVATSTMGIDRGRRQQECECGCRVIPRRTNAPAMGTDPALAARQTLRPRPTLLAPPTPAVEGGLVRRTRSVLIRRSRQTAPHQTSGRARTERPQRRTRSTTFGPERLPAAHVAVRGVRRAAQAALRGPQLIRPSAAATWVAELVTAWRIAGVGLSSRTARPSGRGRGCRLSVRLYLQ